MSQNQISKLRAGEFHFNVIILCLSVIVCVLAYQISGLKLSAPGTFPLASSAVMVLAMLSVLWGDRKKQRENQEGFRNEIRQAIKEVLTRNFVVYTLIAVAYICTIELLHFIPSSFLFISISIVYLKGSSPLKALLISAVTLAFIYIVFLYFFKVLLP
jgi:hypothetical protein